MEIIYVKHPVTPERKAELRGKGYKIIDARFAPEGYEFGNIVEGETQDDQESLIAQLKARGIDRDKRTKVETLRTLLAESLEAERQELSDKLIELGIDHDETLPAEELRALLPKED